MPCLSFSDEIDNHEYIQRNLSCVILMINLILIILEAHTSVLIFLCKNEILLYKIKQCNPQAIGNYIYFFLKVT